MREISSELIIDTIEKLIEHSLINVDPCTNELIEQALLNETSELAKFGLGQILENNAIAASTCSHACQDTGLAVFFVELGQDVRVTAVADCVVNDGVTGNAVNDGVAGSGNSVANSSDSAVGSNCAASSAELVCPILRHSEASDLTNAINEGTRRGYKHARKSTADPLTRLNTRDNTPAIIHTEIVKGDSLKITYLAKGAGSENMSKIYMLTPSKGRAGIVDSVLDCVRQAGANPCPPIVIGVGVGGNLEKSALLSKLALTRKTGELSPNTFVAELEKEILAKVNDLQIGACGYGGNNTCLAVAIETFPTHIGMMPVAVNIQCHSVRHSSVTL